MIEADRGRMFKERKEEGLKQDCNASLHREGSAGIFAGERRMRSTW